MIEFSSDGLKVAGPKVDGSYSVTLSLGEYDALSAAKLIAFAKESLNVKIQLTEEIKKGII